MNPPASVSPSANDAPSDELSERAPSWYSASLSTDPRYPTLKTGVRTDVAVIGGGLGGVAVALRMRHRVL